MEPSEEATPGVGDKYITQEENEEIEKLEVTTESKTLTLKFESELGYDSDFEFNIELESTGRSLNRENLEDYEVIN